MVHSYHCPRAGGPYLPPMIIRRGSFCLSAAAGLATLAFLPSSGARADSLAVEAPVAGLRCTFGSAAVAFPGQGQGEDGSMFVSWDEATTHVTAGGVWNEEVPADGPVYPAFIRDGSVRRTNGGRLMTLHFVQPTFPDSFSISGSLNAAGTLMQGEVQEDAPGRTDKHPISAPGVTVCRRVHAPPVVCTFTAASTEYPAQGAGANGSFTLVWDNVSDRAEGAWNEHVPTGGPVQSAFVARGIVGAEDPSTRDLPMVLSFSQPPSRDVFAFAGTLSARGTVLTGAMDGATFTAHGTTACTAR
jgi:hypothetical protein